MKVKEWALFVLIPFFLSGCLVSRESVGTLLDLKKEQEAQQQYLEQEFVAFKNAYKAVSDKQLRAGQTADEIARTIGEPVERHPEGNLERWLYHDNRRGWFEAPNVYFYFNSDKHFVKWKCVRVQCPEPPST